MPTPKMVFDEWYGELTIAQRAAYRKCNVSPSDHRDLLEAFGDDHPAITKYVKENAFKHNGMYSAFDLMLGR